MKIALLHGTDLTDILKIRKWEPQLPAQLAGKVKGNFPSFMRKSDEPRLQSNRGVLSEIRDVPVYRAMKLDGSSFSSYRKDGVFGVCSRNLDLKEDGGDAYWEIAKSVGLHEKLPEGYSAQGELVGPSIQGNKLGLSKPELFLFNVWDISAGRFLDFEPFVQFAASIGIQTVPVIDTGVFDLTLEQWLEHAESLNYPNGHPCEGEVVRPLIERYSPALDSRLSFKVISNRFLLKTGE